MKFSTLDLDTLATVTGGTGPIAKCIYSALVAGTIALGHPAGQAHDDRAAGPSHPPASQTTTSQCR